MSSPTQSAYANFQKALNEFMPVVATTNDSEDAIVPMGMREGFKQLSRGMSDMAVGLRATYQLIEQLQKDMNALRQDVQTLKQMPRPRP